MINIEAQSLNNLAVSPETIIFKKDILRQVSKSIIYWLDSAKTLKVNVQKQTLKLQETIDNAPPMTHLKDIALEIALTQQIYLRSLYCVQIIRKIAISYINQKLEELRNRATNPYLINVYKTRVFELLPPKKNCTKSTLVVESIFRDIVERLLLIERRQMIFVSPQMIASKEKKLTKTSESVIKWINIATEENINVSNTVEKLRESLLEAPSISDLAHNVDKEALLSRQIFIQNLYCIRIIRKIAISCIHKELEIQKLKPTNPALIELYKIELFKLIPPKKSLQPIAVVEKVFEVIMETLLKMREEVERDNKGINSFNLCNGCGS